MHTVQKHICLRSALSSLTLTGLALAALGLAPSAQAQTVTRTYTTPGTFSFLDPTGVTSLSLTLVGAGGGGNTSIKSYGGNGAQVSGTLAVTPGTTYDILVGAGGLSSNSYQHGGDGGIRSAFQTAAGADLVDAGAGGGAGQGDGDEGTGGGDGTDGNGGNGVVLTRRADGGAGGQSYTSNPAFTLLTEFDTDNGFTTGNGGDGSVTLSYNAPAPVPEASSAVSLGVCLLGAGLLALRARKKKASA